MALRLRPPSITVADGLPKAVRILSKKCKPQAATGRPATSGPASSASRSTGGEAEGSPAGSRAGRGLRVAALCHVNNDARPAAGRWEEREGRARSSGEKREGQRRQDTLPGGGRGVGGVAARCGDALVLNQPLLNIHKCRAAASSNRPTRAKKS